MRNKTALVTGGARGIGLEISRELLKNDYNVAVCDANCILGKEAVESLQNEFCDSTLCSFFKLDISNGDQFKECFKEVKQHYGAVNILVNNAGVADDGINKWEREVDINCKGTIWGCIYGLKFIEKGGTIINISSATIYQPYVLMPVYCMTKSGIVHITKSFSTNAYWDKFNIKVMAVLPGMTDTPILQSSQERYLFPELQIVRDEAVSQYGCPQSPKAVADCIMRALKLDINGSLWVVENNDSPKLLNISYSLQEPTEVKIFNSK